LSEAANRAGAIVSEQIRSMVESAETRATEIRQAAEQEADASRAAAHAATARILERIDALERPLGELVASLRREMDRLSTEVEGRGPSAELPFEAGSVAPVEDVAAREDDSDELRRREEEDERRRREEEEERLRLIAAEESRRKEEERAGAQETVVPPDATGEPGTPDTPEGEGQEPLDREAPIPDTPPPAEEAQAPPPRRGLMGRLGRRRGKIFITEPGACAVCQRTLVAGSQEALENSGWLINGEVGLCPDCQADGWQLPEGARLPFRRGAG